jgi:DNA-binding NarL/FixJ family response regulator
MTLSILLADDHKIVRDGLRSLLEKEPGFKVLAEAKDGREAVRLACELQPEVVIMDIAMPVLNGIEATRQIKARYPEVRVVALSMHADKPYVLRMIKAGASGYLLKNSASKELVLAVRKAADGLVYLSPEIAGVVVESLVAQEGHHVGSETPPLTPREREVLQLVAEGLTNAEIADSLGVSRKTVETHRRQIMEKLGLHNVAELTKFAIREGITSLD